MSNIRTLTGAEARAMFDTGADFLPFRIITDTGRATVAQFVNSTAVEPTRHNLEAWYTVAERAANDAGPGESIVIEMRGMHASNHNPATLVLSDDCFEWSIQD